MKNSMRIILILKYLLEHSDNEHYVTIADINEYLGKENLYSDRDTISDAITQLRSIGYDIQCIRSTQNRYYINRRKFSTAEIKWLIDAVQSSRFIPTKTSEQLIEKLADEAGEHLGEALRRQFYVYQRAKTENDEVCTAVELLNRAISCGKKISFRYYEYNVQKERVLRRDGKKYHLSPFALLWNNDQYYLIGCDDTHDGIVKYRLDRLTNIEMLDETALKAPADFDISAFFEKEFSMMGGELCEVELLCENPLIGSVIDKFGTNVDVEPVDDEHFRAKVEVPLTGTFFGWVLASAGAMRIIGNGKAVAEFKQLLQQYT